MGSSSFLGRYSEEPMEVYHPQVTGKNLQVELSQASHAYIDTLFSMAKISYYQHRVHKLSMFIHKP